MKKALISLFVFAVIALIAVVATRTLNRTSAPRFPGTIQFTVVDDAGNPVANATCTEVNVVGQGTRTCVTNESGTCVASDLVLEHELRFEVKAAGYRTVSDISDRLDPATPAKKWGIHLQAAGNPGDLQWQNFVVKVGKNRPLIGTIFQTQADGSLKPVTAKEGLICSIRSGANTISADIDCTTLTGLAVGCGKVSAALNGKSVDAVVRVANPEGSGEYCPE